MSKFALFCVLCLLAGCYEQPEVRAQQSEMRPQQEPEAQASDTMPTPAAVEPDTVDAVAVDTTATGDPSNNIFSEGRLEGRFFVSGPISEASLEEGRSHYYAWFEGKSAFELYRAIPGEPQEHYCEDGHAWFKRSGQILCTAAADSTSFSCYFALDVPEAEVVQGVSC